MEDYQTISKTKWLCPFIKIIVPLFNIYFPGEPPRFPGPVSKMNDRGLLVEGYKADVTIFNPETVRNNATYGNAFEYATGIEYVIVNGKVSVDKGKFNGALNGKVLLKPQR
jgi:hypothetical protein